MEGLAGFFTRFQVLAAQKGMSPSGAAKALGFSNSVTAAWKKGKTPDSASIKKIADHFGVSVEYLLCGNVVAPAPSGCATFYSRYDDLVREIAECERKDVEHNKTHSAPEEIIKNLRDLSHKKTRLMDAMARHIDDREKDILKLNDELLELHRENKRLRDEISGGTNQMLLGVQKYIQSIGDDVFELKSRLNTATSAATMPNMRA